MRISSATPMPRGQIRLSLSEMSFCQLLQKLTPSGTKPTLIRATVCTISTSSCSSKAKKLPKAQFPGKCFLIKNPVLEEVEYEKEILSLVANTKVLGFDTESKPSFYSGNKTVNPPCLVQLASEEVCVMWRLQRERRVSNYVGAKFPPLLHSILTSKDILKVGHSSKDDALLLLDHYSINMCNVLDTYDLINSVDFELEGKSLKRLTSSLLGLTLDKNTRISNWEQRELTQKQITYACTDAWVSLQTYKSLLSLAKRRGLAMVSPIEDTRQLRLKAIVKKKKVQVELSDCSLQQDTKPPPPTNKRATHSPAMNAGSAFASPHTLLIPRTTLKKKPPTSTTKEIDVSWYSRLKTSVNKLFKSSELAEKKVAETDPQRQQASETIEMAQDEKMLKKRLPKSGHTSTTIKKKHKKNKKAVGPRKENFSSKKLKLEPLEGSEVTMYKPFKELSSDISNETSDVIDTKTSAVVMR